MIRCSVLTLGAESSMIGSNGAKWEVSVSSLSLGTYGALEGEAMRDTGCLLHRPKWTSISCSRSQSMPAKKGCAWWFRERASQTRHSPLVWPFFKM